MDRRSFLRSVILGTLAAPFVTRRMVAAAQPEFHITVRGHHPQDVYGTRWDVTIVHPQSVRDGFTCIGTHLVVGLEDSPALIEAKCANMRTSVLLYAGSIGFPTDGLNKSMRQALRPILTARTTGYLGTMSSL